MKFLTTSARLSGKSTMHRLTIPSAIASNFPRKALWEIEVTEEGLYCRYKGEATPANDVIPHLRIDLPFISRAKP